MTHPRMPTPTSPVDEAASARREAPQATAERVRDGMFSNDPAVRALGMVVTAIAPGAATVTMPVRPDMLNGHQTCHGGLIATLADTAFAYACNSYDELTVASGFSIDLVAPGRLGDMLTARCIELSKAGRTGVYDADITNQRGERIAAFRGRSFTIKGKPAVAAVVGEGPIRAGDTRCP